MTGNRPFLPPTGNLFSQSKVPHVIPVLDKLLGKPMDCQRAVACLYGVVTHADPAAAEADISVSVSGARMIVSVARKRDSKGVEDPVERGVRRNFLDTLCKHAPESCPAEHEQYPSTIFSGKESLVGAIQKMASELPWDLQREFDQRFMAAQKAARAID